MILWCCQTLKGVTFACVFSASLCDGVSCISDCWSPLSLNFVLVQFHEFGQIELGLLEDFDLSDHAVILKWEDFAALLLNLFTNLFFN